MLPWVIIWTSLLAVYEVCLGHVIHSHIEHLASNFGDNVRSALISITANYEYFLTDFGFPFIDVLHNSSLRIDYCDVLNLDVAEVGFNFGFGTIIFLLETDYYQILWVALINVNIL